jgi:hypothetical protein
MHRIALLSAVCALLIPASVQAQASQDGSQAAAEAKLHLGPLALQPKLAIRNLGVDTNTLNASEAPERDVTATVSPELQSWLRVGRLHLTSTSSIDWNYFQRLSSQRSFNGAQAGRADLSLGYVRPYVGGRIARSRQRPNLEIDARVERTTREAQAGIDFLISPRLTFTLGAVDRTFEFGEAIVGEVVLADALNRDERASALEGRFVLTPLTSLVFETEYRQDRFERTTSRDTDTVLVEGGLEFKPLALISGRARVGFRHFAPRDATMPEFRGLTSDVELSYLVRDLTRVTVTVARDLEYSFEPTEPYYVSTGTQVQVVQALGSSWDLVGRAGRTTLAYERLSAVIVPGGATSLAGTARVDRMLVGGGGVGRRLGTDVRVGIDIDRVARRSVVPTRSYAGIRVGGSVTYGF